MGLVENTLTGNLILTVMLAFAEYERGMIVERTQLGKMVARQNLNFKDGRPKKYTPIQIEHALSLLSSGKSYKEVEEITGISKSTMIREKKKELEQNAQALSDIVKTTLISVPF
ncbi:MAG: recombinase family protein [Oscillospiraceae bacterium]|nr:recombinase family protein [Oscillospiraceae bacterium]